MLRFGWCAGVAGSRSCRMIASRRCPKFEPGATSRRAAAQGRRAGTSRAFRRRCRLGRRGADARWVSGSRSSPWHLRFAGEPVASLTVCCRKRVSAWGPQEGTPVSIRARACGGLVVGAACKGVSCLKLVAGCMAGVLPQAVSIASGRRSRRLLLTRLTPTAASVRVAVRRSAPCMTVLGWASLW